MEDASISPGERLSKIEDKLDKIISKLDNKADKGELLALEIRVRDIELHGSNKSRELEIALKLDENKLEVEVAKLNAGQQKISNKIAYFSGGLAVVIIVLELLLKYAH